VYNVNLPQHRAIWQRIVEASFTQDKPTSEELQGKTPKLTQRYLIYEDLFDLPENARHFLQTYLLRRRLKFPFKDDPRAQNNVLTQADLLSWDLTALFLKDIMNMDRIRIDQIRQLGDRLAAHIQQHDDRRLLKNLYYEREYWRFRKHLLRTMFGYDGDETLVTFDGYVQIFEALEEGQGFERPDWNLSRDLLLIRILEQLHKGGYWSAVADALQSEDPDAVLEPAAG
jgi:CRISPR-associated protein Cst1